MEPEFWLERWQANDIGFHQPHIHDQLQRCWPKLNVPKGGPVLVPLCGKSRDMVWLGEHGFDVLGIELSERAIADFFREQALTPVRSRRGAFDAFTSLPYTLLQGDIFDVVADVVPGVAAAYDRAALVALKPDQRACYAARLAAVMPAGAALLLITLDYPVAEMAGPPFAVTDSDVTALFGDTFTIDILEQRDGLEASQNLKKRGVTRLTETASLLRRKP
jgi:thiopurine S-methyltransferase